MQIKIREQDLKNLRLWRWLVRTATGMVDVDRIKEITLDVQETKVTFRENENHRRDDV